MSEHSMRSGAGSNDGFVLMLLAAAMIGSVGAIAAGLWAEAQKWLLESSVLVQGSPVVLSVPGSDGVGLDVPRIVIGGAVLLALVAVGLMGLARLREPGDSGVR